MASIGFFTYHDLYGGKPESYHQRIFSSLLSSTTERTITVPDTTTTTLPTTLPTTINIVELVSSTTIRSSTSSNLYKLVQLVPFAYFHWFLIGLAVLLTLLLSIIFTCYCRSHCRKSKRARKEKKQPLPNFYRYRPTNRRSEGYNIFETSAAISVPSPKRPCPPKSVERLNNKLLRQGLDAVGSPQIPRTNLNQVKPSSTFTNTASNLLTEIKSRFGTHSSEPPPPPQKNQRLYETQRTNMVLNDESQNDSLLIDMN